MTAFGRSSAATIRRLGYPLTMSDGVLFLKRLHLNPDGTCTDFDVREGKPSGRTVVASTWIFRQAVSGSGA